MRKIAKAGAPRELARWQSRGRHYKDLTQKERRTIRKYCRAEQKGLCAFCCAPVTENNGRNAHILCQARHPHKSLDWNNIVTSCETAEHCDTYQGGEDIPLTPLMPECETELLFKMSGRVEALTPKAQRTLEVLNLDCPGLQRKRKFALESMLLSLEFHPVEDIPEWDEELIQCVIAECDKDKDGILFPYAPVIANIVRQFLDPLKVQPVSDT